MAVKFACAGLMLALAIAGITSNPLDPETFIINGQLAAQNQYPWHVSVIGTRRDNTQILCGGALVGPAHVLTSAYCVIGYE